MKKYPAARPYITKREERYVLEVLRSGRLSLGPKQDLFERRFARKIGTKYACAVSSGTAGLHLALVAAGIGAGDEVITSPFSFVASANAIIYVGAKPVFADIEPITCNIDPAKIETRITKRTKAILVVHIFGQSADMAPILAVARKFRLKIIEDACESVLATYRGRKVGTFGESAVFAFYPNKQMTTGEGGMIVTNDRKVLELVRSLRNQGRGENRQWLDHVVLGYNYRMGEMNAALGLAQLEKLDFLIEKRRKIAEWYKSHLAPFGHLVQCPKTAEGNTHSWFVYVVRLTSDKIDRDKLIRTLAARGISTKPYLPAIHLFNFYRKKFGCRRGDFPVTENVSQRSLALPFYIDLIKKDVRHISGTLIDALTERIVKG